MSRESLSVFSGLVVMLAGALTVWAMTTKAGTDQATPSTSTTVTTTAPQATVEMALPDLPGVPPEVQRVLYWKDKAEAVAYGDLSGIPPVVQRVLIEYDAPLMVRTDASRGASQ